LISAPGLDPGVRLIFLTYVGEPVILNFGPFVAHSGRSNLPVIPIISIYKTDKTKQRYENLNQILTAAILWIFCALFNLWLSYFLNCKPLFSNYIAVKFKSTFCKDCTPWTYVPDAPTFFIKFYSSASSYAPYLLAECY